MTGFKIGDRVTVGDEPTTTNGGYVDSHAAGQGGVIDSLPEDEASGDSYGVKLDESPWYQYIGAQHLTLGSVVEEGAADEPDLKLDDRLWVIPEPEVRQPGLVGFEALLEAERLIEAVMGGRADDTLSIARARHLIAVGYEATA